MTGETLLEPEQFDLLRRFVEAPRGAYFTTWPHEDAQATFIRLGTNERFQGELSDADILASLGLGFLYKTDDGHYSVTPKRIDYYNRVLGKRE